MSRRSARARPPIAAVLTAATLALGGDSPQWGARHSRNMVSPETGLPVSFHPSVPGPPSWTAEMGTKTYGTPVIAEGRVIIGTNYGRPRDARRGGDRGVLMCFAESDGRLLWQLAVPKLTGDIYLDWPGAGLCSPPTVEEGRLYVLGNRGELLCLGADGLADGNDGPFFDEDRFLTP